MTKEESDNIELITLRKENCTIKADNKRLNEENRKLKELIRTVYNAIKNN